MSYKEKSYLIVDDMKVLRKVLSNTLVKFGIPQENIHLAEDGKEAIEKLKGANVDVIFSDWNMPVMDGLEFLKFCKASEDFKKIPFIMLTSEADKDNVVKAMEVGVNGYLLKSVQMDQLLLKISTMFK